MWILHPDAITHLERGGRTVRMTSAQMHALNQVLSGTAPVTALPSDLFRELFEAGLVTPGELPSLSDPGKWIPRLPALSLAPQLRFSLGFRSGPIRLTGMEPSIGLFLDPEAVRTASQLSRRFLDAARGAVLDSAVRGLAFPREKADRHLQEMAERWLAKHPRRRQWLQWNAPVSEAAERSTPSFPDCALTVGMKKRRRGITLPTSLLPALAAVFDVLRGGSPSPETTQALGNPAVAAVLDQIDAVGGLIPSSEAPAALSPSLPAGSALAATHLGHAHILAQSERHRILIDPLLFPGDEAYATQPPGSRQLGRIDAIFFTHHHEDHLEAASLLTLPHDVPVYVPPDPPGYCRPRLGPYLRAMGFRDVRALAAGTAVEFSDGLRVEAVPFHGESSATLGWNGSCYLLSRGGRNILLHADASPDLQGRSLISTGELQRIVSRVGPVDVIFGSWWQEHGFAGRLSSSAMLQLPPARWLDDAETCDCPPEYLRDLVRVCGAREFLFYAESGEELFLPEQARSDYIPNVSFLWRSREEVASRLAEETGVRVTQAQPYLRVLLPFRDPIVLESRPPAL